MSKKATGTQLLIHPDLYKASEVLKGLEAKLLLVQRRKIVFEGYLGIIKSEEKELKSAIFKTMQEEDAPMMTQLDLWTQAV